MSVTEIGSCGIQPGRTALRRCLRAKRSRLFFYEVRCLDAGRPGLVWGLCREVGAGVLAGGLNDECFGDVPDLHVPIVRCAFEEGERFLLGAPVLGDDDAYRDVDAGPGLHR
jgi:hypothetical protein